MNIRLHPDKCIACGLCASIAPTLFSIDSGVVSFKKDPTTYTKEEETLAREAAASCPNGVIEIVEN